MCTYCTWIFTAFWGILPRVLMLAQQIEQKLSLPPAFHWYVYTFIYMLCWYACACLVPMQEGFRFPRTEESQCGCWELNLDFLKERHVLLILEPSLQLLHSIVTIPALCWSVRFCKNRYHGRHLMQELVSLSIHANTNAFKQEKIKPVKVEEHEFEQGCLTVTAEVQQLCVQDGSFELT